MQDIGENGYLQTPDPHMKLGDTIILLKKYVGRHIGPIQKVGLISIMATSVQILGLIPKGAW